MGKWEPSTGASDEWYTPQYVFDALGCRFDLDVAAAPIGKGCVPADDFIREHSLLEPWHSFIWMNPPFGGRNGIAKWLHRFALHGNGIALTPDRTSAPWWQWMARRADMTLFVNGKIRFIDTDGAAGKAPSNGTSLFAMGARGKAALLNAQNKNLGICLIRVDSNGNAP